MMPPPPKWTVGEGGRRGCWGVPVGGLDCYKWLVVMLVLVGTLEKIVEVGPIYAAAGICLCCD